MVDYEARDMRRLRESERWPITAHQTRVLKYDQTWPRLYKNLAPDHVDLHLSPRPPSSGRVVAGKSLAQRFLFVVLTLHTQSARLTATGDWSRAGKIPPVCYSLDVRPWSFFSSSVAGYGQSACYFGECVLALVLTRADGHRSTLAQQIACIRAADMLEL